MRHYYAWTENWMLTMQVKWARMSLPTVLPRSWKPCEWIGCVQQPIASQCMCYWIVFQRRAYFVNQTKVFLKEKEYHGFVQSSNRNVRTYSKVRKWYNIDNSINTDLIECFQQRFYEKWLCAISRFFLLFRIRNPFWQGLWVPSHESAIRFRLSKQ